MCKFKGSNLLCGINQLQSSALKNWKDVEKNIHVGKLDCKRVIMCRNFVIFESALTPYVVKFKYNQNSRVMTENMVNLI
jgi:hypothetical protein